MKISVSKFNVDGCCWCYYYLDLSLAINSVTSTTNTHNIKLGQKVFKISEGKREWNWQVVKYVLPIYRVFFLVKNTLQLSPSIVQMAILLTYLFTYSLTHSLYSAGQSLKS
jgi:hypothetical protein